MLIPRTLLPDGRKDPTYISWSRMKQRVGRGYCDMDPRWKSFRDFFLDMGARPDGKTLDRVDNKRGYWPDNCRWATAKEQRLNSSAVEMITWQGETLCQLDWANKLGISAPSFRKRLLRHGIVARTFAPGPFPAELMEAGNAIRVESRQNSRQYRNGYW